MVTHARVRFLLFTILFALFAIKTELNGFDTGRDIYRFQNGVKFTWLADFWPKSETWHHSFVVETPLELHTLSHRDWLINKNISSRGMKWLDDCLLEHDIGMHGLAGHIGPVPKETSYGTQCHKHATFLRKLMVMVQRNHMLVREKLTAIENLLPSDINPHLYSRKRSFSEFLGSIISGPLGIASQKDLDKVSNQLRKIASIIKHGEGTVHQSLEALSSYSNIIDKRIANLFKATQEASFNSMQNLQAVAQNFTIQQDFLLSILSKMFEHNSAVTAVLSHLELFEGAMKQLTTGFLPSYFVPPNILKSAFYDIQTLTNRTGSYHLISQDPFDYYRKSRFTYHRINNHLIITLEFPLSHFPTSFQAYSLQYFSLAVPGQINATMILNHQQPAVAFQTNHQSFLSLTALDALEIKLTGNLDFSFKIAQFMHSDNCLVALFLNLQESVKQFCKYVISLHALPSKIVWVQENRYLLTGTPTYQLSCPTQSHPIQHECSEHCILTVSNLCQLFTSTEFTLPLPSFPSNTSLHKSYIVNYPYLLNFFSSNDMAALEGNILLNETLQLQLPPLKIFQHPIKTLVDKEAKLQLDMDKVVQSIKADSTLLDTITDGILYTDENRIKLFGDYIELILLIFIILFCLSMVHIGYLAVKLRTISLLLAVLQQNLLPQTEADLLPRIQLPHTPTLATQNPKVKFGFTPKTTISDPEQNFHTLFTSTFSEHWSYIFLGFLAILITFTFAKFMCRRYLADPFVAKTTLIFQFSYRQTIIAVPIHTFAALPAALTVRSVENLGDFRISGSLFPRLIFHWDSTIKNQVTASETFVSNSVGISYLTGRKLRSLLNKPFQVQAFFHNSNMFSEMAKHLIVDEEPQIPLRKIKTTPLSRSQSTPNLHQSIFRPVAAPRLKIKRRKTEYV